MADWPSTPNHSVRARCTASLSVPTGTDTAVPFDTTDHKTTPSMHDTTIGAVALAGTVAKTNGTNALVGTGTSFTSDMIGRWITVPGGASETRVIATVTDATHLATATNFANTSSGQTATIDNRSKVVIPVAGVYAVTGGIRWPANATGTREAYVRFNGAGVNNPGYVGFPNGGSRPAFGTLSVPQHKFAAGDYLELFIAQFSTVTLIPDVALHSPVLAVTYLCAG